METEQITIQVDVEAARVFKSASPQDQRKLEALLSIRLTEVIKSHDSLKTIMGEISQKAKERGLTPKILRSILDEE